MTVFADFESLWDSASDQEKRAIKAFIAAHRFPAVGSKGLHTLPDDFIVTETMREWATRTVPRVNISLETQKFRDHWVANAGRPTASKSNWEAAWRSWMRKAGNL